MMHRNARALPLVRKTLQKIFLLTNIPSHISVSLTFQSRFQNNLTALGNTRSGRDVDQINFKMKEQNALTGYITISKGPVVSCKTNKVY